MLNKKYFIIVEHCIVTATFWNCHSVDCQIDV